MNRLQRLLLVVFLFGVTACDEQVPKHVGGPKGGSEVSPVLIVRKIASANMAKRLTQGIDPIFLPEPPPETPKLIPPKKHVVQQVPVVPPPKTFVPSKNPLGTVLSGKGPEFHFSFPSDERLAKQIWRCLRKNGARSIYVESFGKSSQKNMIRPTDGQRFEAKLYSPLVRLSDHQFLAASDRGESPSGVQLGTGYVIPIKADQRLFIAVEDTIHQRMDQVRFLAGELVMGGKGDQVLLKLLTVNNQQIVPKQIPYSGF